jgi:DNA polymerase delta subunit 1
MKFQAVAWDGEDCDGQYTVRIFGRAEDGRSVAVSTHFNPYFFIKIRKAHSFEGVKRELNKRFRSNTGVREVHAKDLWGFQNNTLSRFVRIEFETHRAMRSCAWVLDKEELEGFGRLKVYEANLDPILRFMHVTGISSTGWLETGDDCEPDLTTSCNVNIFSRRVSPVENDACAPLKIASFDIECYSASGNFPDPRNLEDVIFQIGITTTQFGREGLERKCLCMKPTDGDDVEVFQTEKALLTRFGRYIRELDPDVMTGWNVFGFDLEYMQMRAVLNNVPTDALVWGRVNERPVEIVTKNLSSSALGNNMLKMVPMAGRYVFDLFQDVKREHKLESYSLNNVSKHFLKDQKNDMPVKEIFRRYASGTPAELGEVAEYCLKDTELPHKIMEKLCHIQNVVEMAKACWVPMSYLSERGQQIKVFSQMAYKARQLNFLIPTFRNDRKPSDGKYQGATVLDPKAGAYYTPITALDFASLYPSIMCAHNLCYSTLVMDDAFDNLPGVEYEKFGQFKFAQGVPSLLPDILTDLKKFRKKAKKDMAAAEGTPMEAIYNGRQLAYKISMNSIYGFTGAQHGMLPLEAIASTVTMRGRQMIDETKSYVEANFPGAKVRYGDTDSVMVEFDVEGRKGQEAIEYSWQLGERAAEECSRLFKAPNELELEKVYCPYFLYSKKRYAAKMYEKKGDEVIFKKIDVKGLQVVRRDSCAYVRETLKSLLEMVLESDDPLPAIKFARKAAKDLKEGKVPHEKLLMSKQLASEYKVRMPHVAVRDKIRERAPGSEPQQGDRVSFLIVEGPRNALLVDKAEDPAWVITNGIKIDYNYYYTNQMRNPVCDFLEPLVGKNPEQVIFPTSKSIKDFFPLKT